MGLTPANWATSRTVGLTAVGSWFDITYNLSPPGAPHYYTYDKNDAVLVSLST